MLGIPPKLVPQPAVCQCVSDRIYGERRWITAGNASTLSDQLISCALSQNHLWCSRDRVKHLILTLAAANRGESLVLDCSFFLAFPKLPRYLAS